MYGRWIGFVGWRVDCLTREVVLFQADGLRVRGEHKRFPAPLGGEVGWRGGGVQAEALVRIKTSTRSSRAHPVGG